jgi:hypothetical protein
MKNVSSDRDQELIHDQQAATEELCLQVVNALLRNVPRGSLPDIVQAAINHLNDTMPEAFAAATAESVRLATRPVCQVPAWAGPARPALHLVDDHPADDWGVDFPGRLAA